MSSAEAESSEESRITLQCTAAGTFLPFHLIMGGLLMFLGGTPAGRHPLTPVNSQTRQRQEEVTEPLGCRKKKVEELHNVR
jgi:hypothetical protein